MNNKKKLKKAMTFLLSGFPPVKRLIYGIAGYLLYHEDFKNGLSGKNILLIGTPEHGNLGDHAIAYATKEYLHRIMPDFNITEISEEMFFKYTYCLKRYCKKSDIFILSGGGNIGNHYRAPEQIRRYIISSFPKNKVIIFPQTAFFTNDPDGRKQQKKSLKIYNKHKNIIITAREQDSYDYLRQHLPDKQILISPDMAFYLDKSDTCALRDTAVICFRKDRERILGEKDRAFVRRCLEEHFDKIISLDTSSAAKISADERNQTLEEFWASFGKAGLIVTDRLHGMIFAAITGTPCIAVSNYNHKIRGSYQWIKHLPYIRYLEDPQQIEEAVRQLTGLSGRMIYDREFAMPYYEKLKEAVIE